MDQHRINLPSLLDQHFGLCISPQDLLLPHYSFPMPYFNYYRPWKWYNMQKSKYFVSTISDEKDKFKICLDVQHFQPSEVNVKVTNNEVIVEGNHEERKDNHGFISRRFKRRYVLPKDCNADSVVSSLSSDGVLIVTADKTKYQGKTEIIVPIKVCSRVPDTTSKQVESTKQEDANNKTIDAEADKKKTALMLKEDHCRLLKPELLGEVAAATFEKKSVQASTGVADLLSMNTEMCGKVNDQSKQTMEEKCELSKKSVQATTGVADLLSVNTEMCGKVNAQSGQTMKEKCELSKMSVQATTGIADLLSVNTEMSGKFNAQSGQTIEEKCELSKKSVQATTGVADLLCKNAEMCSKINAESGQKTKQKCELSQEKSSVAKLETLENIAGASRQTESCELSKEKSSAAKLEKQECIAGVSRQTESCSMKSMVSERIEVQQSSSSYSSSMSSSLKETTAKINELVSDISAQLKEAAENI